MRRIKDITDEARELWARAFGEALEGWRVSRRTIDRTRGLTEYTAGVVFVGWHADYLDTLAHELAHVRVGGQHHHDDVWLSTYRHLQSQISAG